MHFGEFNPLDVLAAAAVQHSDPAAPTANSATENNVTASEEGAGGDEDEDDVTKNSAENSAENGPETVESTSQKVVEASESNMVAPLVTDASNSKPLALQSPLLGTSIRTVSRVAPKEAGHTKIVIPNKDGKTSKTLTVLKMKGGVKPQGSEHAYAYLCQVDGAATKAGKLPDADDEGYCSRSSLDSPGQSSRSDSDAFEQDSSVFDSTQKSPVIRGGPMSPPPPRVTSPRPTTHLLPRTTTGFATPLNVKKQQTVTSSPANPAAAPQKILIVSGDGKPKTVAGPNSTVFKSLLGPVKDTEQTSSKGSAVKTDSTKSTTAVTLSSSSSTVSTSSSIASVTVSDNKTDISAVKTSPKLSIVTSLETKTVTTVSNTKTDSVKVKEESSGDKQDQEEVIDVTTFTTPVDKSLVMTSSPALPSTVSLPSAVNLPSSTSLPSAVSSSSPATLTSVSLPSSTSLPSPVTLTSAVSLPSPITITSAVSLQSPITLPSTVTLPSPTSSVVVNANNTKTTAVPKQLSIDSNNKRVPLLINTSLGQKVTTSGGPVTYLLVPPPVTSTKGVNVTSGGGLVLSQLGAKNQYIIQDDLPPATKLQSGGLTLGPKLAIGGDTTIPTVQTQHKANLVLNHKAPMHAKPVSLLSKPVKASGALLCIDANTGRPVFTANNPSQLGIFTSKMVPSSSSVAPSSSASSSTSSSQQSTSSVTSSSTTSSSSSTLHSLENPDKQINIKISGSKVIDMASLQEISPGTVAKKPAATSIGNIGSLSLTKIDNASPVSPRTVSPLSRTVSPLSAASSFSPIGTTGSRSHTPLSMGGGDTVSLFGPSELEPALLGQPSHSTKNMSARTCHTYVKRKNSVGELSQKGGDIGGMRLHPLIDHDYCMFTEFSADIQSSIIATTESKLKTERKYSKKTKAARCTKVLRTPPPEKAPGRKKRKYTRRIPLEKLRQQRSAESSTLSIPSPSSVESLDLGSPESGLSSPPPPLTPVLKPESPGPKSIGSPVDKPTTKPKTPTKRRDGRNYVKITGSYQDEFVYFATKKTSGRPRKYHDSVVSQASVDSVEGPVPEQQPTPATVAGINVFDWYRDLSNTDKSSRFGMEDRTDSPSFGASRTPEHDSEVVDLVMEMANDSTVYSEANMESFTSFVDSQAMQSETVITTPSDESKPLLGSPVALSTDIKTEQADAPDIKPEVELESGPSTPAPPPPQLNDESETPCHIDDMVAEVQDMLSSMGEDELKMISENLTSEATQVAGHNIVQPVKSEPSDHHGLNAFLASYSTDCGGPAQSTSGAFDLDDIADSDLLPMVPEPILPTLGSEDIKEEKPKIKDIKDSSTLNMLFSDSHRESPLKQFTDDEVKHEPTPASFTDKLDRSELFPDITGSQTPQQATPTTPIPGALIPPMVAPTLPGNTAPPELTVVSMYWNDLPGLMLNGKQHVRLVDIHKQMLPAKDTGTLISCLCTYLFSSKTEIPQRVIKSVS